MERQDVHGHLPKPQLLAPSAVWESPSRPCHLNTMKLRRIVHWTHKHTFLTHEFAKILYWEYHIPWRFCFSRCMPTTPNLLCTTFVRWWCHLNDSSSDKTGSAPGFKGLQTCSFAIFLSEQPICSSSEHHDKEGFKARLRFVFWSPVPCHWRLGSCVQKRGF